MQVLKSTLIYFVVPIMFGVMAPPFFHAVGPSYTIEWILVSFGVLGFTYGLYATELEIPKGVTSIMFLAVQGAATGGGTALGAHLDEGGWSLTASNIAVASTMGLFLFGGSGTVGLFVRHGINALGRRLHQQPARH